jgi:hypothetical protein
MPLRDEGVLYGGKEVCAQACVLDSPVPSAFVPSVSTPSSSALAPVNPAPAEVA